MPLRRSLFVLAVTLLLAHPLQAEDSSKTDWVKKLKELSQAAPGFQGEWKVDRTVFPDSDGAKQLEEHFLNDRKVDPAKLKDGHSPEWHMLEFARNGSKNVLTVSVEWHEPRHFRFNVAYEGVSKEYPFWSDGDEIVHGLPHKSRGFKDDVQKLNEELCRGVPALYATDWFDRIIEAEVEEENDKELSVCAEFPELKGHVLVRLRKPDLRFLSIQQYRGTWLHADAEMRSKPRFNARLTREWMLDTEGSPTFTEAPEQAIVRQYKGISKQFLWQEERWTRIKLSPPPDSQATPHVKN